MSDTYYCDKCRDAGPCDMHCRVCGTDVYDSDVESYTIGRWIPSREQTVLVCTVCAPCWATLPLP